MRSIVSALLVLGLGITVAPLSAAKLVHDSEYYVLEKQNGERWSVEDKDLDKRLAEFRK